MSKPAHWTEYPNHKFQFFNKVADEVDRAREKFPGGERLLGALMEEVGEMAEALLKIKESNESAQRVYDEAIQVAAVAFRLAAEGEPDYGYEGVKCHHAGCKQAALGGPCALCYE